jgi:hypothetical protein
MVIGFRVDENRPLPRPTRDHVQRCVSCRRLYETEGAVAGQLVGGAGPHRRIASPFLHAKIMRRLNRQPATVAVGTRPLLSARSVAAITIALVLAGLVWRQGLPSREQSDSRRQTEIAETATELSTLIHAPSEVQLSEWSHRFDQPLETELELVVSDARTAITHLADNFLPDRLRESAFGAGP